MRDLTAAPHQAEAGEPTRAVDPALLVLPSTPGGLVLPVLPGALCRHQDPALWFPGRGQSFELAKAVCRACPAKAACLDWAMQSGERDGVWGGASPDERDRLRRARTGTAR
jgi:WhiB family redox-sensing transcriptional regulator